MGIFRAFQLGLLVCVFYDAFCHDHKNIKTSAIVEKKFLPRTKRTIVFPDPTNLLVSA